MERGSGAQFLSVNHAFAEAAKEMHLLFFDTLHLAGVWKVLQVPRVSKRDTSNQAREAYGKKGGNQRVASDKHGFLIGVYMSLIRRIP